MQLANSLRRINLLQCIFNDIEYKFDESRPEDGDPNSKHFFDQGLMYSKGQFKGVLLYEEDVLKHVERSDHPE